MSATVQYVDSANLFVGDANPANSLFLTIKNVKLPVFEEVTKDHLGGGAAANVAMGMSAINPLELTFQIEGIDPAVEAQFMPGGPRRVKYTLRANITDLRDHTDRSLVCVVEGRMTRIERSEFTREQGLTTDFGLKEILFYSEHIQGVEQKYFNYWRGLAGVRVNGALMFANKARNLGLA